MATATKTRTTKATDGKASVIPQGITPAPAPAPVQDLELEIRSIVPSALNPRVDFDEAALRELAESIKQDGVLQPIIVRPKSDHARIAERLPNTILAHVLYEIVAGERRWRAAQLAGLRVIPARVRHLTDEQHARIALVENLQRRDLNAIEEADGYKRLQDLGMKQGAIAMAVNRQQPSIAKALALLKLPDDVRARIQKGELSGSHGTVLAQKYGDFPKVASALATRAVKQEMTSHQLESASVLRDYAYEREGLVAFLPYYDLPFVKSVCQKACPFGAYRAADYQSVCLKPEHFAELKAEHEKREAARLEKAMKRATDGKAAKSGKGAKDAPKLPKLADLDWKTYQRIESYSKPKGCTAKCACRGLALSSANKPIEICTDPKQFKKHVAADTRAKNAAKAAKREQTYTEIAARLDASPKPGKRELAIVAMVALTRCNDEPSLKAAARAYGGDFAERLIGAKLHQVGRYSGSGEVTKALHLLVQLPEAALLRFAAGAILRDDLVQWENSPLVSRWYVGAKGKAGATDEDVDDGEEEEADTPLSGTEFHANGEVKHLDDAGVRKAFADVGEYSSARDAAEQAKFFRWGEQLAKLEDLAKTDDEAALQLGELKVEIEAEGHDPEELLELYEQGDLAPAGEAVPA